MPPSKSCSHPVHGAKGGEGGLDSGGADGVWVSDKGADEAESACDGGSGVGAGSGAAGDFAADSGEGGASSPVAAPQAPKMSSYAYTVAPTAIGRVKNMPTPQASEPTSATRQATMNRPKHSHQ